MKKILLLLFFVLYASTIFSQKKVSLSGVAIDKSTQEPIKLVAVLIQEVNKWSTTNEYGEFTIDQLKPGIYTLYVTYLGYKSIEKQISIDKNIRDYKIELEVLSLGLDEVVVTAKERELGSASRIDQSAMQHLQPKSVEDVLQLLPGSITKNPSLADPGQVKIREVYTEKQNGDDQTSALGAAVIVDGAPLSNDANMQAFSTAKSGTSSGGKASSVAGRGIDLREISADNIESVEVIRGIPSVEYGDLTSGVVNIKTKAGASPYEAKIAIDPGTKIFYLGKGFELGSKNGVLNASLDYTTSYSDIRKKYDGYKRITGNLAYSNSFKVFSRSLSLNSKFAFFSTVDAVKRDAQYKSKEAYRSSTDGLRFGINGKLLVNESWLTNVSYNFTVSASHQDDYSKELQTITAGSFPLATSLLDGEFEASFLRSEYYSEMTLDGKPFSFFGQLKANTSFSGNVMFNNLMYGVEYRISGNNGAGKLYDVNFPPSINSSATTRPRSYDDVPDLNTLSLFIEDKIKIDIGSTKLTTQIGVRYSNIEPTGLFSTAGAKTIEPRINVRYQILNSTNNTLFDDLSIKGGYGVAAKSPTLLHLYPDKAYFDESSLNYKDEQDYNGSLVVLTTKIIEDTSNPDLKPAVNKKRELGFDFRIDNYSGSFTGYYEKQTGGFNFTSVPVFLEHRNYIVEGGGLYPYYIEQDGVYYNDNGTNIAAQYELDTALYTYNKPINDKVMIKKGVEFSLNLGSIKSLKTKLMVSGAWMFTKSYNTHSIISKSIQSYNNERLPYFIVKPAGTAISRQRISTTINAITHIPAVKTVISFTTQIIWLEQKQYDYIDEEGNSRVYAAQDKSGTNLYEKIEVDNPLTYIGDNVKKNVDPLGYIDKAGNYYEWDPSLYLTRPYSLMISDYNDHYFLDETYPPVVQFNIKITKELVENISVAFTANNFLNIRPYHKYDRSSGYVKRNTALYFGGELKVKF